MNAGASKRLRRAAAIGSVGPGHVGLAILAIASLLACVPERGGWDVEALAREESGLDGLPKHRLGDMVPFPAFDGDRVALVACRFSGTRPIRVRGAGPGWPAAWARVAVEAVDRMLPDVDLILIENSAGINEVVAEIQILSIAEEDENGPTGLGDTLSECDVSSASADGRRGPRGELTGAEIRMRRARVDMRGRVQPTTEAEWIGALMHELGHALGFAGHAASGDSILVQDESKLRRAGRRALEGQSEPDTTLEALYRVRPGSVLGMRSLRAGGRVWIDAMRATEARQREAGIRRVATRASVGDREARVVWRNSDGLELVMRFPFWSRDLRRGGELSSLPNAATRRILRPRPDPAPVASAVE